MLLPLLTVPLSLTPLALLQISWTTCTISALPAMVDTTESAPGCGESLVCRGVLTSYNLVVGSVMRLPEGHVTQRYQVSSPFLDPDMSIQQVHMMHMMARLDRP